jgi:CheY-like chemotaxis protein
MEIMPKRILIIDDDASTRTMFSAMLEIIGFKPVAASGGEEALKILETQQVDGIILDYMMPGMNGIEVFNKLKTDYRTCAIPVVMVTARLDKSAKQEALEAGIEFFKTKPIQLDQLEQTLQFALYDYAKTAQIV